MASVLPSLSINWDTENAKPRCCRHGSRRDYQERLNLRRAIRRQLSNGLPVQSQKDITDDAN